MMNMKIIPQELKVIRLTGADWDADGGDLDNDGYDVPIDE